MNLAGDKVKLRSIEKEDFLYIIKWNKDQEINQYYDPDQTELLMDGNSWYQKLKSNRYQQKFMIIVDELPIGDLEFDHITWRSGEAELKIRIGEKELWNNGYGTDAVKLGLRYAFQELNLTRVYLRVYADNARAIQCYQNAGFFKEGRLARSDQQWRDIILMQVVKEDFLAEVANKNAG